MYCEGITVDELRGREVSKTVERDPVKRPAFRIMLVWMEAINIGRKGKKGQLAVFCNCNYSSYKGIEGCVQN